MYKLFQKKLSNLLDVTDGPVFDFEVCQKKPIFVKNKNFLNKFTVLKIAGLSLILYLSVPTITTNNIRVEPNVT